MCCRTFAAVIVTVGLCDDFCIFHHFDLDLFGKFGCLGALVLGVIPAGDLFLLATTFSHSV